MSEQKSKNPLQKIKEKFEDKEEQLEILGTFIRLGVMVWAGFIISLNYITIPGLTEDREVKDITFIASVFTGCLATFNITPGGKKKKDEKIEEGKGVANSSENVQTIRIIQEPIKIIGVKEVDPKTKT
tara:strand:- start:2725 stop:3108 length:384 start_codon:yes stop_codon:yes gene_type:complete